ncbi:extracellular solute-binding protein [Occultella gossypii]|uniref:Extracellular solute-binding protein n=1 Tax=Occultella gossypii TaxID=2800820 RepID=A0ABS7SGF0_9MICO|nr:extracellular solute-binding protein [Occultella gossypii]MBZ2199440.1 extracellular solute-binding protein [Occultella gossypii]
MKIDRRSFLGLTALAGVGALSACGPDGSAPPQGGGTSGGATPDASTVLPTYQAFEVAAPDLPSDAEFSLPGYYTYPASPTAATTETPGAGSSITAMTYTYDPIAPELSNNQHWQNINSLLGVDLGITYSPSADYDAKFATTIAGGDLPDMINIRTVQQQMPAMLAATFADLTEHLSGDAVLDYPALAAIPEGTWRTAIFDNAIWGVPIPRSPIGGVLYTRNDLLIERGANTEPANYEEFVEMATTLTDASKSQWAFGDPGGLLSHVAQMNGVGNQWVEENGEFSYAQASPAYEQALADTVAMIEAGLFHPDSAAVQNTERNEWVNNGTTCFAYGGYAGWSKFFVAGAGIEGFQMTGQVAPGRDGGDSVRGGSGFSAGFMAFKPTDDPERIAELLRILNWLASPFGSTEFLARKFGVEGVNYTLEGSDPVLTSLGAAETTLPLRYLSEPPSVLYEPGNPDAVDQQFEFMAKASPLIVPDPTTGLYSETAVTAGATAATALGDARNEILAGRQPVSSWSTAVEDYMLEVGNSLKDEYEAAFAAQA